MNRTAVVLHLTAASALVGCYAPVPTLPRTPNLYLDGNVSAMEGIAPDRQTVDVDLLYATDREPNESQSPAKRYYDERRSDSLAITSSRPVRCGSPSGTSSRRRVSAAP